MNPLEPDFIEVDSIDFCDHKKLEKLQEKRAMKWLKLYMKAQQGDAKAIKAIKKHDEMDRILRRRANDTGYYWA